MSQPDLSRLVEHLAFFRENADLLRQLVGTAAPVAPAGPRLTFAVLWKDYFRAKGSRLRSARTDSSRVRNVLATKIMMGEAERAFGSLLIGEITRETIVAYLDRRRATKTRYKRPTSAATRNRELALIKKTFSWARKERITDAHPALGIPLEAEDNVKKTKLPPEAFEQLLTFCNPVTAAMALCYYDSGNRKMEIVNLRWPDFDHETGRFQLFDGETKSGEGRISKLSPRALAAVLALPRICEHVFANPKTGRRYNDRYLYRMFEDAVEASGLKGFRGEKITLHTMRHQFVRNGRRRGIPEKTLMAMGGWKTRSAFDRYGIVDEEETDAAFDRLHQELAAPRKGPHGKPIEGARAKSLAK